MEDRKVSSIKQVNFNGLRYPAIVIYENPSDYPEKYVARVFDIDVPTNIVMIKDTLAELQNDIREHTNMIFFTRGTEDVETIVGVWM